ncbi:MAG: type II secretion system F family protein, partial [Desulfurococcales archaeon]|nr:type II secretion system F family protein [Desulfurococcales archaeon]
GFIVYITSFIIAFMTPLALWSRNYIRAMDELEADTGMFIRDFMNLIRSGMSIEDSLNLLARRGYRRLTIFIHGLQHYIRMGYTFRESFEKVSEGLPRRLLIYLSVLTDVFEAGGRAVDVAVRASTFFSILRSLEDMRERNLRVYSWIVVMSMLMFEIAGVVLVYFIATSTSFQVIGPAVLTAQQVVGILFYSGVIISVFAGLLVGKIVKGDARAGIWYIYLFLLMTGLTYSNIDVLLKLVAGISIGSGLNETLPV